ncbi:unnamed protein product, partial [Ceratitis capitata]
NTCNPPPGDPRSCRSFEGNAGVSTVGTAAGCVRMEFASYRFAGYNAAGVELQMKFKLIPLTCDNAASLRNTKNIFTRETHLINTRARTRCRYGCHAIVHSLRSPPRLYCRNIYTLQVTKERKDADGHGGGARKCIEVQMLL